MTTSKLPLRILPALLAASCLLAPLAFAGIPEPVGPGAPASLVAQAGPGPGAISLSWQAASSLLGVTNYTVYHVEADGSLSPVGQTDGATLSFVETGLAAGQTVSYVVTASDVTGEGPASNVATATTFTLPDAPQDVAASPGAAGSVGDVVVSWAAPASDGGSPVVAYNVYRDGAFAAKVDGATLSWTDQGLTPLTDHVYAVSAVTAVGEGAQGGPVCAMASPWGLGVGEPACLGLM